ncbi:MAG: hypothetical protein ACKER6_00140 [Candidatus Hodgkinia cicadicola]
MVRRTERRNHPPRRRPFKRDWAAEAPRREGKRAVPRLGEMEVCMDADGLTNEATAEAVVDIGGCRRACR